MDNFYNSAQNKAKLSTNFFEMLRTQFFKRIRHAPFAFKRLYFRFKRSLFQILQGDCKSSFIAPIKGMKVIHNFVKIL
ncbi:MAG: hypothetical protein RLZZ628_1607 [Bacteroidota bacterium]